MYEILVRLMVISAILQLGLSASDFLDCRSMQCFKNLGEASRSVLEIDWKPISVFPAEGRRFR